MFTLFSDTTSWYEAEVFSDLTKTTKKEEDMQLVIIFHDVEMTDFLLGRQVSLFPELKIMRQRNVALKAGVSLPALFPISTHSTLLASV